MAMKAQDRVKERKTGRLGTLCPSISMLRSDGDDELSVVFDGAQSGITLNCFEGGREAFEVIGPENAVPDFNKCGAGKGPACCIFLTMGANGFCCERFSDLRYSLIFKRGSMVAQRDPTEPYPNCMNQ